MSRNTLAIARGAGVIGATVALMVGATFANLGASASLTGNTLATGTAGLQVQVVASGFGSSQQGFQLTDLVPGVNSTPFAFNLETTGSVPLNLTASVPSTPTFAGFLPGGFSGVNVAIQSFDGNTTYAQTTLAALLAGPVPMGSIAGNTTNNYRVIVEIDPSVVTGSSASIDGFTILFTGTE